MYRREGTNMESAMDKMVKEGDRIITEAFKIMSEQLKIKDKRTGLDTLDKIAKMLCSHVWIKNLYTKGEVCPYFTGCGSLDPTVLVFMYSPTIIELNESSPLCSEGGQIFTKTMKDCGILDVKKNLHYMYLFPFYKGKNDVLPEFSDSTHARLMELLMDMARMRIIILKPEYIICTGSKHAKYLLSGFDTSRSRFVKTFDFNKQLGYKVVKLSKKHRYEARVFIAPHPFTLEHTRPNTGPKEWEDRIETDEQYKERIESNKSFEDKNEKVPVKLEQAKEVFKKVADLLKEQQLKDGIKKDAASLMKRAAKEKYTSMETKKRKRGPSRIIKPTESDLRRQSNMLSFFVVQEKKDSPTSKKGEAVEEETTEDDGFGFFQEEGEEEEF
jgi:hypothetical protein